MVWSIVSAKRRRRLVDDASRSREDARGLAAAIIAIALYNIVGLLDIYSTSIGVGAGLAEEVNPLMRAAMENFGAGWIAGKLVLQAMISAMVLWFPHRIVLAIFIVAVMFNAGVVYGNLRVAGIL
ncbi:MAG: DUF5658 family protein [Amphiplicatus sp.]